jgi:quercetin dioxygenase-like cupin family protein
MIEKVYNFTTESDSRVVEKIVNTDEVQIIHMIFPKGEGTPKHFTNSKVHLIVQVYLDHFLSFGQLDF